MSEPTFEDAFEAHEELQHRFLTNVLLRDLENNDSGKLDSGFGRRQHSYVRALALCVVKGLTSTELSRWFKVAMEWLAWTFL